jgi:GNAT superfamily N-acetyltransferase
MAATIEIEDLTPQEFVAARPEVADVYRTAFAEDQYPQPEVEVRRFREVLDRQAQRSGFKCKVARTSAGQIVGIAYGYTGAPGQWWHDIVAGALPGHQAQRWLGDCFELVELHLMPHVQGRGIGGRLHDTLLAGLPHKTAALSTINTQTRALHLYRNRGWVTLLEDFTFPGGTRPFLIMGLDLESWGHTA